LLSLVVAAVVPLLAVAQARVVFVLAQAYPLQPELITL
jgi:hypothetical protein